MREFLSYSFLMPPTIFIVVCLVGALIALFRPRIGTRITLSGSILLYVFATPAMSSFLVQRLTAGIPIDPDYRGAQAIVVPGADIELGDGAGTPDTVGPMTLERLAGAARLYRRLHLPVVVSGGVLPHAHASLAGLMRDQLKRDFSVPVKFAEDRSHTTFENALYTAAVLKKAKIDTVIVVAQARDMPRVLWSFNNAGLKTVPSAIPPPHHALTIQNLLPSSHAFLNVFYAFHEMIGLTFYRLAY